MLTLARAVAVVACCLPLALPAAAFGAIDLTHVQAQAVPVGGDGDDVVGPGDAVQLTETVSTATALSNATGTLFTPTPGVVLETDTAPFASTSAGSESINTRPFEAALASNLSCGANLSFTVHVAATGGQDSVSFIVPTGTAGPPKPYDWATGQALADNGVTNVQLNLPGVDRVKRMEVRIGALSHPRLSDLELALVAPDGTETVLAEQGSLTGTTMTDTVFADGSLPIAGAFAPYTGRFAPRDSLAALEGRALNGTWALRVTDGVVGQAGTLGAWGLNASKAYCAGIPKGAFTATPNPALPMDVVEFDASASLDSGGSIDKYEWDLDGDGQYDDGTTARVSKQYPVKTSVLVRLRVTDNDGLVDIEEQRLPVTEPPVAALTAAPVSPLTGDTVLLDAGGSDDPDGNIVRYQWAIDQTDVPERDTQGVSYLEVSFDTPKTYTVAVWVTDEDGAKDKATFEVVVRNRPPVADIAAPALPLAGRVTTLSAAGSTDPDGTIDKYEWDLNNDGDYEAGPSFDATLDHTFATPGTKTVRVRVTDDKDETATSTETFTVTQAPTAVLTATPNPVSLRDDVTLDASDSSDPDAAGGLTFEWDLVDDGVEVFGPAGPDTRTISWPTAGTRTVKVRVTDVSGAVTIGSVAVVVRNILPVAALSANPAAPVAGEATQLSAVASDADGAVVRYQWDLDGDQTYELDTGTTPSAAATFANAGNNTVGVRVTDDDGGTGTKALTLTVGEPPAGPGETPPPTGGTGTGTGTGGGGAAGGGDTTAPAGGGDGGASDAPTEPAGGPAADDPAPVNPARPFGAWIGGAAIQRTKQVLARGLLLSCRSEVAVWCSVKVSVSAKDAKKLKLGRKAVTVAKTALPVPEGGVVRTRVKLSAKARRALKGKGGVKLLMRAVARAADGREVALTRVVLLRR